MTEAVQGVSGKPSENDGQAQVFSLWAQQLDQIRAARAAGPANPPAKSPEAQPAPQTPRMGADAVGTRDLSGQLNGPTMPPLDLDQVSLPSEAAASKSLPPAARALAELGVVTTMGQVAAAFARSSFSPGELAGSLGRFTENLTQTAGQLAAVPGVGAALEVFGGVGGIVSGLSGLKEQIGAVRQDGLNLKNGVAAAASAARLVSGVAMALAPLCPPMAAIGGTIALAGAALEIGKLGLEARDAAQSDEPSDSRESSTPSRGGSLFAGLTPILATNGASMVGHHAMPILSSNGANMVAGDRKGPFAWLTG